ncbi:MAG TPA: hypothetical protein VIH42_12255 [Thermoguttaceae bacterium]
MTEPLVAASATTTAESITQDTTTTATAPVWTDGLPQETLGFVEKKGWKGNADVITSYQNLEKLHGVPAERIIKLPEKLEGAEMDVIYNRLGRPEKPDGYKIPVPEGEDAAFSKTAATWFHKHGLSAKQAEGLATDWNDYAKTIREGETQKSQTAANEAVAALKTKWGAAYEQKTKIVDQTATSLGLTKDDLLGLRTALGPGRAMEFIYNLGTKMGEADFITGETAPDFGSGILTPEQAKRKIGLLREDTDFVKRYTSGNVQAKLEMEQLSKWAYPDPV